MPEMIARLHTLMARQGQRFLLVLCCFLVFLFAASLFTKIAYPLFWADESMTAMQGKRVLEYGYPKVHDGKNVVYDLVDPDSSLGVDKKTDAYIGGANWFGYYVAAVGIELAELSDDMYVKTAIIRTLFALFGLAGLTLIAFLATQFYGNKLSKTLFLIFFVVLELISVPLVLHLREARYYPLTVFFTATTIFTYAEYRMLRKLRYRTYFMLLIVSLFFLFVTFSPAYFISLVAIFLYELATFIKQLFFQRYRRKQVDAQPHFPQEGPFRSHMRDVLPVLVSLIIVYPLVVFFDVFHISKEMAKFYTSAFHVDELDIYKNNLEFVWRYFASTDLLYLAIFLKCALLSCFFLAFRGKPLTSSDMPKVSFSAFLTLFFVVYCFAIAKIPNLLFTRYIIPLQPVLALIIILDTAIIYNFVSTNPAVVRSYIRGSLMVIIFGFLFYNISSNADNIRGHIYELSHRYRGPLDYVIPFIKEKYATTDNLVIATNYEETSFMFYLNAKVIVGYVGNNLNQDTLTVPDIIVYRKGWGNFTALFDYYFSNHPYVRITLPVDNLMVNNIPELNWPYPWVHRFQTEVTGDERKRTDIYLRM